MSKIREEIRTMLESIGYNVNALDADPLYTDFEITNEGYITYLVCKSWSVGGYRKEINPLTGESRHCGLEKGCFWTDWEGGKR